MNDACTMGLVWLVILTVRLLIGLFVIVGPCVRPIWSLYTRILGFVSACRSIIGWPMGDVRGVLRDVIPVRIRLLTAKVA